METKGIERTERDTTNQGKKGWCSVQDHGHEDSVWLKLLISTYLLVDNLAMAKRSVYEHSALAERDTKKEYAGKEGGNEGVQRDGFRQDVNS